MKSQIGLLTFHGEKRKYGNYFHKNPPKAKHFGFHWTGTRFTGIGAMKWNSRHAFTLPANHGRRWRNGNRPIQDSLGLAR